MPMFGNFSLPTPEAKTVKLTPLVKTDPTELDSVLLGTIPSPNAGDIAVIDTVIDGVNLNKASYMYDGTQWVALNGNVEADKVILTTDITMAGNYTQVGNLTKAQTGTATFATKGKSVADALLEIFSKKLQPTITANPSLGTVTISRTGLVEAGTSIASMTVNAVTFNAGSYSYAPTATGVTVTEWEVFRVASNGTTSIATSATTAATTDTGPFVMGDQSGDLTSLAYRVNATHTQGNVANDNLGTPSDPEIRIAAGTVNRTSSAVTPFRKYFYGGSTEVPGTIDSAFIRSLTNSTQACSNGRTFSIAVPEGAKIVTIAYPATFHDLTSVIDVGAFGTDIISQFVKSTVQVAGANGYAPIAYSVFTYTPKAALGANTYNVTV